MIRDSLIKREKMNQTVFNKSVLYILSASRGVSLTPGLTVSDHKLVYSLSNYYYMDQILSDKFMTASIISKYPRNQ